MSVWIAAGEVKFTVPVMDVNVPEFVQSPVSEIVPDDVFRVPALVTLPGTLSVPELTLKLEPAGTLSPAAQAKTPPNVKKNVVKKNDLTAGKKDLIPDGEE